MEVPKGSAPPIAPDVPPWGRVTDWIYPSFGDDMKMKVRGMSFERRHIEKYKKGSGPSDTGFHVILDRFETLDAVSKEIQSVVDVDCGLIFGIDYTMSNKVQGTRSFGGKSLHDISEGVVNPYQEVICILGETLEPLDDDGIIPAFGFGDKQVKDKGIFKLKKQGECEGFLEVLNVYKATTKTITLGGPTNFAPIIEEALTIVKEKKMYHILVIVADGQMTREEETIDAIVRASDYPLSIVVIGVGDGPWDEMRKFDDKLPQRRFDNFQFVDYCKAKSTRNPEAAVALAALMEVPINLRRSKH